MEILNVKITTSAKYEILQKVTAAIMSHKKLTILTPNPEIITYAARHPAFCELLNTSDINLADGVGLKIGWFLRHPFAKIPFEIIHGIDFMLDLCAAAEKNGWGVGLFGGMNGAAEKTRDELLRRFPELKINYVYGDVEYVPHVETRYCASHEKEFPMRSEHKHSAPALRQGETHNSASLQNNYKIDILFVALGTPKEQLWIAENRAAFPATVFMQVGGAFDILSARLRRAPRFMQRLGLEWMWRLILEPKRIWRQLRLVEFLVRYLFT